MILQSPYPPPSVSTFKPNTRFPKPTTAILNCNVKQGQRHSSDSSSPVRDEPSDDGLRESMSLDFLRGPGLCCCGRRRLIGAIGTTLLVMSCVHKAMLNSIHPRRPDWYEELYALALDTGMKSYEAQVAGYKSLIFANVRGKVETVLEIGIGAGPNLKYYASDNSGVRVFGIDPNKKMEKYAQAAALNVGLPPADFKFIHAVAEALPLPDASVDAVVGTLVLCSVKDVNMALKERLMPRKCTEVMRVLKPGGLYLFVEHVAGKGMETDCHKSYAVQEISGSSVFLVQIPFHLHTPFVELVHIERGIAYTFRYFGWIDGTITRFVQGVLDPLQQTVSDGCHLTRTTGKYISEAGFSNVDLNMVFVPNAYFVSPHVYGIACK
ncbi:hypothetical protein RHMOL_Rhmol12G0070400 [Rhododendron molle]|uniref:Uncharacterized protein n=1 Tax=Rhododendron molle TaxID=49168 RepID=A0ACC0LGE9_RHOML|nr:hypothetical protein RHMOL_Rhmol12G0070400 [Rhododendron molle]